MNIYRARLTLFSAVAFALVFIGLEFPYSTLLHQRAAVASTSAQFASVQSVNNELSLQISSLHRSSTIAAIAHEEYGLVRPGESSFVILPAPDAGSSGIAPASVPVADLVAIPTDALAPTRPTTPSPSSGFLSRLLNHLEFWH